MSAMKTLITFLLTSSIGAFGANWVKLFDGKTLNGWSIHSGTATYAVEDGAIVGTAVLGSPNTFLCTDREYGDFVLEFEVKVDPELNSGVQFRSLIAKTEMTLSDQKDKKGNPRKIPADRVYGYQVEIASTNAGNVYDEARRAVFLDELSGRPKSATAFKEGAWNKYRIETRGDSIKTWVNGVLCADFKDSATPRGIIGLQVHQVAKEKFKPYQVRWRNIRIMER
jgi:hypothetical protein